MDSQLFELVKTYCRNVRGDLPESILLGCAKLCRTPDTVLNITMEQAQISEPEKIKAEIKDACKYLSSEGYDAELIKNGMPLVIGIFGRRQIEEYRDYAPKTGLYDGETSLTDIIADAVEEIKRFDQSELKIFESGKSMDDVIDYRENHKATAASVTFDGTEEKPEKDTKSAAEPEKNEFDEEVVKDDDIVFSGILKNYLNELKNMIPKFREMKAEKYLWSQSLILSMDDGFGISTFGKNIAGVFIDSGLTPYPENDEVSDVYAEMEIDCPDSKESKYDDWNKIFSGLSLFKKGKNREDRISAVLCVDISKWTSEMGSFKVKEYLKKINEKKDGVFIIFRIPYMDRRTVAGIEAYISDIMGTFSMVVPPDSTEKMAEYLLKKGEKNKYDFEDGCLEYLERGIIAEKNDGKYYGYRTLNKMFDTIVYKKIKYNYEHELNDRVITVDQLGEFLNCSGHDRSAEEMMSDLVGIDDIIKEIDNKIKQIKISREMAENGNIVDRPSIHMMFKGSPGTGKTTVARIVAKKLKDAGILSKGNLYEIKGRDLCGRYIGETTPKTCAYCRDAYGSVLFIDEAYELYRGADSSEKDYGREALTALVAEMENHRDDMCVIFAGYTDEMNSMVQGNPGLESRIPIVIDFPNYTRSELEDIFFKMVEKNFEYDKDFREAVHDYFNSIPDKALEAKEFSNARFVRNLFENVWGAAVLRQDLDNIGKIVINPGDLKTAIDKVDFTKYEEKRRPIGFLA